MNLVQSTIVRNGNHFILFEGAGWVLIDGPWFDVLNRSGMRYVNIPRLPRFDLSKPIPLMCYADGPPQVVLEIEKVSWERLKWGVRGMSRPQLGWRMLPNGPLPTSLDSAEYDDPLGLQMIEYEKTVWYEPDPIHHA